MPIKMYSIQIRMQIMPKHGILNCNQVSSLNLLLKLSSFNKPGDTPASGCVSIMFGFKMKK